MSCTWERAQTARYFRHSSENLILQMCGASSPDVFCRHALQIIQRRSCGQNQQIVRFDEFEMFLAELLVLFGIKRRVEEDVPVFVSEFCQGSGQALRKPRHRGFSTASRPRRCAAASNTRNDDKVSAFSILLQKSYITRSKIKRNRIHNRSNIQFRLKLRFLRIIHIQIKAPPSRFCLYHSRHNP